MHSLAAPASRHSATAGNSLYPAFSMCHGAAATPPRLEGVLGPLYYDPSPLPTPPTAAAATAAAAAAITAAAATTTVGTTAATATITTATATATAATADLPPPTPSNQQHSQQAQQGTVEHLAADTEQPVVHRQAGVAILVRSSLLTSHGGSAKLTDIKPSLDGRLIHGCLYWGGHRIRLASVYMPNAAAAQRQFIEKRLVPLRAVGGLPVWGGDYNFAPAIPLDRHTSRTSRWQRSIHPDVAVAAQWRQQRMSDAEA